MKGKIVLLGFVIFTIAGLITVTLPHAYAVPELLCDASDGVHHLCFLDQNSDGVCDVDSEPSVLILEETFTEMFNAGTAGYC